MNREYNMVFDDENINFNRSFNDFYNDATEMAQDLVLFDDKMECLDFKNELQQSNKTGLDINNNMIEEKSAVVDQDSQEYYDSHLLSCFSLNNHMEPVELEGLTEKIMLDRITLREELLENNVTNFSEVVDVIWPEEREVARKYGIKLPFEQSRVKEHKKSNTRGRGRGRGILSKKFESDENVEHKNEEQRKFEDVQQRKNQDNTGSSVKNEDQHIFEDVEVVAKDLKKLDQKQKEIIKSLSERKIEPEINKVLIKEADILSQKSHNNDDKKSHNNNNDDRNAIIEIETQSPESTLDPDVTNKPSLRSEILQNSAESVKSFNTESNQSVAISTLEKLFNLDIAGDISNEQKKCLKDIVLNDLSSCLENTSLQPEEKSKIQRPWHGKSIRDKNRQESFHPMHSYLNMPPYATNEESIKTQYELQYESQFQKHYQRNHQLSRDNLNYFPPYHSQYQAQYHSQYYPQYDPQYDPQYYPKYNPQYYPQYYPKYNPQYYPKYDPLYYPQYQSEHQAPYNPPSEYEFCFDESYARK